MNNFIEFKLKKLQQLREQKKEIENEEARLQSDIKQFFEKNNTDSVEWSGGTVKRIPIYRIKSLSISEFLDNQPEGIDISEIKVSIPSKYKHLYPNLTSVSQQIRYNKPKEDE